MGYDDKQAWEDVRNHFPDRTIRYIYILKKGSTWTAEETPELDALQEAHLANMRRLTELGKIAVNGPFLDSFATSGELRGMGVMQVSSYEEAHELISTDPMVRVDHLAFEIHAWMIDRNILP